MNYNIETTPHFEKELKDLAKRYKSMKQDFGKFKDSLKEDPFQGVDLGGGLRKIRMAIDSKRKGKAGGARVITYTTLVDENTGEVWLIEIYDKSEFSTIKTDVIKKMLKELGLYFSKDLRAILVNRPPLAGDLQTTDNDTFLAIHCVETLHLIMEHRSIKKTIFPFFRNMAYSKFSTQDSPCYCSIGIRISA